MHIAHVIPQLRTTNLGAAIEFYTATLGFALEFQYEDFYACVRAADRRVHLKLSDAPDPSLAVVEREEQFQMYLDVTDNSRVAHTLKRKCLALVRDVHETAWRTRELVLRDPDGHTLYFGQPR